MEFSDITDQYVILKLPLTTYTGTRRTLCEGFDIGGYEVRDRVYKDEKDLLKSNFKNWKAPFHGRLAGWRKDSGIYALHNGRLAGSVYLCERNEFGLGNWGQMHYNAIIHHHRGKGLYSLLFAKLMALTQSWGLEGVIINTDRHLHPEMYVRWGAVQWKTIDKSENATGNRCLFKKITAAVRRCFTADT